jgi:acetyltransferase-like isoleucine patch superfamily enzyme
MKSFLLHLFSAIYSFVILNLNKVEYKQLPFIRGRIYLWNYGKIIFQGKTTINSSGRSNSVGMSKRFSIYTKKGAIVTIGDNTGFSGVSIHCINKIQIGNDTIIGANTSVWDNDLHELNYLERLNRSGNINSSPIYIGSNVFIGESCRILKGVTIGDRSIVGAGSIVTKNIPSDEIWAGNPAVFIRSL